MKCILFLFITGCLGVVLFIYNGVQPRKTQERHDLKKEETIPTEVPHASYGPQVLRPEYQTQKAEYDEDILLDQPIELELEEMPEYPGGESALMDYIKRTVVYPDSIREMGIKGRVICTFIVNESGRVDNVRVVRGLSPSLDKEAVRVISSMSRWKPGKKEGKPVAVNFTLPVRFGDNKDKVVEGKE